MCKYERCSESSLSICETQSGPRGLGTCFATGKSKTGKLQKVCRPKPAAPPPAPPSLPPDPDRRERV